jgi:molybdate transport system ATP-binding protein
MSIKTRIAIQRGDFSLDVDLTLPSQGVTALFGRSGSGKTTILRAIAGLERLAGITLVVDGVIWQDANTFLPIHQRPIGYVFQEASLFPHLTVKKNLLFGYKRLSAAERKIAFDETVQLLGLSDLLDRYPDQLSGGQRQRAAIGRALLTSPRLLLMDEPMAALDMTSKAEILPYLERLQSRLQIPIIYVSHAIEEVARLAHYMVLLQDGRSLAQGPLNDLLTRCDLPLAHSANAAAALEAIVVEHGSDDMSLIACGKQQLIISRSGFNPGDRIRIRVQARDVALALQPPMHSSICNALAVTICEIANDTHAGHLLLRLDLEGQTLLSRITRRSQQRLALTVGQPVYAMIKGIMLDA